MTMRAGARTRQLQEFAAEGLDLFQIAERIGMKPWRVREYARKRGIEVIEPPAWSSTESELLDRQIKAERRRKPRPYADPELSRACKAIMAYPLKSRTGFRNVDRSVKGGAWLT